jgi:xanthine/CO dehydrogenase XdhC/CoxF family maturation factor
MKELTDILSAWREHGAGSVLATVVRLEGSGYRRPGARLLVLGDGRTFGSISGGCIERDVIYRAGAVAASGEPIIVRYDAVSEEEAGPGASLGCGGTIDILIEPANENSMGKLAWLVEGRRRGVIATLIEQRNCGCKIGWRIPIDESEQTQGDDRWPRLVDECRAALELGQSRQVRTQTADGSADFFLEYIEPPLELVIFGAGQDSLPLSALARSLGWRVRVVDLRSAAATSGRTFDVDEMVRIHVGELEKLKVTNGCAAVVMNHNWNHDLASLKRLAAAQIKYLGVLGPRRRTDRMLARLGAAAPAKDTLHYPVGLDIGAETPQEVALSIIAEITALLRGGTGGSLRDKAGPIHLAQDSGIACPAES